MNRVVVIDCFPLSLLANPKATALVSKCHQWAIDLRAAGSRIIIPEIADYEVRRELLRAGKPRSIAALDALAGFYEYLPLTTAAMRRAAELWAEARRQGRPTASDDALDADVILAAQALTASATEIVVATSNVRHLARFVAAESWESIAP